MVYIYVCEFVFETVDLNIVCWEHAASDLFLCFRILLENPDKKKIPHETFLIKKHKSECV